MLFPLSHSISQQALSLIQSLQFQILFVISLNNSALNECEYAFPTTNHLGGMVKPAIIQSLQFQTPFVISLNKQGNLNFHSF